MCAVVVMGDEMRSSRGLSGGNALTENAAIKVLLAFFVALTIGFCGIVAPLDTDAQTAYAYEEIDGFYYDVDGTYTDGYGLSYFTWLWCDSTELALDKGKKKNLRAYLNAESVQGKTLTWKSSKPGVVSVSSKGVIKAKKVGKAKITVKNAYRSSDYVKITVEVTQKPTKNKVYKKLMKLKKTYREGKTWGNEKHYFWKAANMDCYACIALSGKISDTLFGKGKPIKYHKSFKKIKIGDHIRIGGAHSVIVLTKNKSSVTVVEGNFNGRVHWGRTITRSELASSGFVVWTRY